MSTFHMPYEQGNIEVEFTYTKGWSGSREEPPENDEMEIDNVYFEGYKVNDIVNYETIEEYFWENFNEIKDDIDY